MAVVHRFDCIVIFNQNFKQMIFAGYKGRSRIGAQVSQGRVAVQPGHDQRPLHPAGFGSALPHPPVVLHPQADAPLIAVSLGQSYAGGCDCRKTERQSP